MGGCVGPDTSELCHLWSSDHCIAQSRLFKLLRPAVTDDVIGNSPGIVHGFVRGKEQFI